MVKQAKDYDPNGEYVKLWCPELKDIPASSVQTPWKISGNEQKSYNCVLGKDYPHPIVVVSSWEKHSGRAPEKNKLGGNSSERVGSGEKKISKNRQQTKDRNEQRSATGGGWKRNSDQ